MKLYSENKDYKLYNGSMLDMLEVIEPQTIDSIVCDPPYELNFMGKGWDNSGIAFQVDTWKKCYEVLKPGGYLLAFGGSRTFYRIACAIEDAGFEIRDTIMWLYGSGFPKSMDISKQIDKKLGGIRNKIKATGGLTKNRLLNDDGWSKIGDTNALMDDNIPVTEVGKQWQGWGTALKPSFEPIIVARKPFKGSCIDNVLKYGVGGINIDECRVGNEERFNPSATIGKDGIYNWNTTTNENEDYKGQVVNGRFPANTILTYDETDFEEVCGGFPNTKSVKSTRGGAKNKGELCYSSFNDIEKYECGFNDSGSASRYFYCAKASKKDRDEGLNEFQNVSGADITGRKEGSAGLVMEGGKQNPFAGKASPNNKNTHPTVKPTELMQYLVRLVSPDGATILDPFNGSGSTGKAVMYENKERNKNYKYIGIELTEEYLPIAKTRIEYVYNLPQDTENQLSIFDLKED